MHSFLNHIGYKKKSLIGIFVVILIVPILFFSKPKESYAYAGIVDIVFDPGNFGTNIVDTVANVNNIIKEGFGGVFGLDSIAWVLTKNAVQKLTAQTVDWINSGFKGNPAYITDPKSFFLNVGDEAVLKFIEDAKLTGLCTPFKASIQLSLVKNYLAKTNEGNFSCTLGGIVNNFESFTRNFENGGWEGWFAVTQNRQNNPYGTYLDYRNQLKVNVAGVGEKYSKQLDWGKGFFSWENCMGTEVYNNETGETECMGTKETVTPGSVIQGQLDKELGHAGDSLVTADEIDEVIGALFSQLIGKVVGGISGGLRGTKTPQSTGRTFIQQLNTEVEQAVPSDIPTLYLFGKNPLNLYVSSLPYEDTGASAYDSIDGDITANIITNGSVDATTVGSYTLTYDVTNSRGKSAPQISRTVNVSNLPPPPPTSIPTIPVIVTNTPDVNCVSGCSSTGTPTSGICGPVNGTTVSTAPVTNLCTSGSASAVNGTGPWYWSCNGFNGGQNAQCSANPSGPTGTAGQCATPPNNRTYSSAPSLPLCTIGTASPSTLSGSGPWSWNCVGTASTATCSAQYNAGNAECAIPPHQGGYIATPSGPYCTVGTASPLTTTASGWDWSCVAGTSTASCYATKTTTQGINGQCGSANGVSSPTAPTANLCTVGTASTVTLPSQSGPWSWSCQGTASTAQCSAPISGSTAAPTASFMIDNGIQQVQSVTVPVGAFLTYRWSSFNGGIYSSTYSSTNCSAAGAWAISSATGSISGQTTSDMALCGTYTFTYNVTNPNSMLSASASVYVTVIPPQPPPTTCQLRANGSINPATITAGTSPSWSVTSNPSGLLFYWHISGAMSVTDSEEGPTPWSNSSGEYIINNPGTYYVYAHVTNAGNHSACTTNTITLTVNP